MYAPGQLGNMKFSFLINTGCMHNLLSKSIFRKLPATMRDLLEPWVTTATVADGSGLIVYGKVVGYRTPRLHWSFL